MWTEVDVDMTVPITEKYFARYPNLRTISFDRGYSSKEHREALASLPAHLPKKGKLSKDDRERQSTPEFKRIQRNHPRIESRINCLEQHGGGRIRTKGGKAGFARTFGACVVATNLCRIGMALLDRELEKLRRAA